MVPARPPSIQQPQLPTRAYLDAVAEAVSSRRLLGERLSVVGPDYTSIDIELRVLVAAGADANDVRQQIEGRLRARLSDLPRDDSIEPWPLGRPVTRREIQAQAALVPGVVAVRRCRLAKSTEALADADIQLGPIAIAIAGDISIATDFVASGDA